MKEKRIIAIPQPVINGQRGGCYRPVRLVLRQYTAGRSVLKKLRNVVDIPDIGIAVNRVTVVEMKAIVKMVEINGGDGQQNKTDI